MEETDAFGNVHLNRLQAQLGIPLAWAAASQATTDEDGLVGSP